MRDWGRPAGEALHEVSPPSGETSPRAVSLWGQRVRWHWEPVAAVLWAADPVTAPASACTLRPSRSLVSRPLCQGREARRGTGRGSQVGTRGLRCPCSSLLMSSFLSPDSFVINMGDSADTVTATPEAAAAEVSLFSVTDMILFSLILGLLSYWFLFRKKKEEVLEFTKISTT